MSRSNHSSRNRCEAALPPVLQQCRLIPSLVSSSSFPTWFGMRALSFHFYEGSMSRFNHSFRNRCEAVLPPVLQQCRLIPSLVSSSLPTWFGMRGAIFPFFMKETRISSIIPSEIDVKLCCHRSCSTGGSFRAWFQTVSPRGSACGALSFHLWRKHESI